MNRFSAVVMTALVASLCFLDSARAANALETALVTCWSCHGAEGLPHDPTVPIIQGQQAKYLEKQLRDFREGDREDQIMSSMAESIPFKDLARAAELIAAKTWPARPVEGAPAAEPGVVATCKACHEFGPPTSGVPVPGAKVGSTKSMS